MTSTFRVTVAYSKVEKATCWMNACGSYNCAAGVSGGVFRCQGSLTVFSDLCLYARSYLPLLEMRQLYMVN